METLGKRDPVKERNTETGASLKAHFFNFLNLAGGFSPEITHDAIMFRWGKKNKSMWFSVCDLEKKIKDFQRNQSKTLQKNSLEKSFIFILLLCDSSHIAEHIHMNHQFTQKSKHPAHSTERESWDSQSHRLAWFRPQSWSCHRGCQEALSLSCTASRENLTGTQKEKTTELKRLRKHL